MKTLEFFYDYISPYSYLAATQVESIANRAGAQLVWRPFFLGAVFKATGNTPPGINPYKASYMLSDLLRWTRHYGLPDFTLPDPFPVRSITALRLGLVAAEQGSLPAYTHALYHAVFALGQDQGTPEVLSSVLNQVGMSVEASFARAEEPQIKELLRKNTDEAVARGSFGAPTLFVGEEMFIGNDRLAFVEKALTA
jgi:2-hydroxychromene-2-carboxylate isomerase